MDESDDEVQTLTVPVNSRGVGDRGGGGGGPYNRWSTLSVLNPAFSMFSLI